MTVGWWGVLYCQVVPVVLEIHWKTMVIFRPVSQSPADKTILCQPVKTQWHTIISMCHVAPSAGSLGSFADLTGVWLQPAGSGQVCSMALSSVRHWLSPLTESHACPLVKGQGLPLHLWWEKLWSHREKAVDTWKSDKMELISQSLMIPCVKFSSGACHKRFNLSV